MSLASGRMRLATAMVALLAWAAAAPAASASSAVVAHGQTGSFPWVLQVSSTTLRGQPAICARFLSAWGPGQPLGGESFCNGAAEPRHTPRGTVWTFDLHAVAEGWDGVIPDAFGAAAGSIGLRAVVLFVDPRASNAVATLRDHEVIHNMRTHSLPRKLHRQARIAWSVQSVTGVQVRGNGVLISRAVAYDSGGQVVGRFPPPRP
ncbi:MAG: hypothetical protein JO304_16475 [Solirubrobacterales bacterium]|nr:hypothetical protein [Solirubrobacterales bacterium]